MPIIDLHLFAENNLDIRLIDGSEWHIRKPSVRLMLATFAFEHDFPAAIAAGDEPKASALTLEILTRILSHNTEGVAVDEKWMTAHGIVGELAVAVYNAFASYLHELESNPLLRLPSKPGGDDDGDHDAEYMSQIGTVCAFAHVSIHEALDMPCDLFSACVRRAYIDSLNATPEGRKHLDDCERLTKTEPDYDALRAMTGYTAKEG